jgi:hypothetical protein
VWTSLCCGIWLTSDDLRQEGRETVLTLLAKNTQYICLDGPPAPHGWLLAISRSAPMHEPGNVGRLSGLAQRRNARIDAAQ